ncbi:hypothetical protein OIU85_002072 [Salix viminalis]|uniref:Peptide deformylase n=1 Tax=Salix viminalis TaxID=40686 RepID=A0A9Q0VQ45_SALVM|nr:hypothetical protein OIU85_002072 [Salix viminalis]
MATCPRCSFLSRALLLPYLHSRTQTLCEPSSIARFSSTMKQPRPPPTFRDLEFEAPLKIVEYPDPILRAKNKRIDTFDDNLKKLVDEMFDVMYKTDGIGLSAPQYSKKTVLFNEGCLSFPGIYADVKRPESVKIDARDINGARFTVNLSGLPARVFQHEFDHLEGILFFDRMTEEVLDSIREGLQALEKKYEDKTGFPSPERIETRRSKKVAAGFGKL